MTRKEAASCINTIVILKNLCYRVRGLMDVIDAQNCDKIIEMLNTVGETHKKHTETHACDVISRQDAIEALHDEIVRRRISEDSNDDGALDEFYTEAILRRLQSAQPENDWIPCTKKAHPDTPFRVQVQLDNGWIITAYYQDGEWLSVPDCDEPLLDKWIEAWRELPEPYQGEGEQDGKIT